MPQYRAVPVMLSAGERKRLKKRACGAKTAYRDWLRAQIVLAAARGRASAPHRRRPARQRGHGAQVAGPVRRPRAGWAQGPARSGRPRRISALDRAAVVALACQLPAATGVPLARWSGPELAAEITKAGLGRPISPSSVVRILAEHPIKPWQYQSWISPRDPDFAAKATVILDLYQGYYQGKRLRPGDQVISVDAKPSIQARARCHPTSPPAPGRPIRVEHEYERQGALALLAALDVHTGKVFASTPATTGIAPFMALMGQVMSAEPYKSASRVFVIVDNGSDHRGKKAVRRLRDAWPPLELHAGETAAAGAGVRADLLGTAPDPAGGRVITYHGWPLYTYLGDASPGHAAGQGKNDDGGYWYVMRPSGQIVSP
jgi:hypothetical protein